MKEIIKRTHWLINKEFQLRFCVYTLFPMLVAILCFWISIELLYYKMFLIGEKYNLPPNHGFYQFLSTQKKEFYVILALVTLILSVIFFLWGILFSHRIAGPLYKLRKYLDKSSSIDDLLSNKLHFRKDDFFKEIPESFNHLVEKISKK